MTPSPKSAGISKGGSRWMATESRENPIDLSDREVGAKSDSVWRSDQYIIYILLNETDNVRSTNTLHTSVHLARPSLAPFNPILFLLPSFSIGK